MNFQIIFFQKQIPTNLHRRRSVAQVARASDVHVTHSNTNLWALDPTKLLHSTPIHPNLLVLLHLYRLIFNVHLRKPQHLPPTPARWYNIIWILINSCIGFPHPASQSIEFNSFVSFSQTFDLLQLYTDGNIATKPKQSSLYSTSRNSIFTQGSSISQNKPHILDLNVVVLSKFDQEIATRLSCG